MAEGKNRDAQKNGFSKGLLGKERNHAGRPLFFIVFIRLARPLSLPAYLFLFLSYFYLLYLWEIRKEKRSAGGTANGPKESTALFRETTDGH